MSDIDAVVFSAACSVNDSFRGTRAEVPQLDRDIFVLVRNGITCCEVVGSTELAFTAFH